MPLTGNGHSTIILTERRWANGNWPGAVKGPPPEYSDAVHCLLLAQLDQEGGCTHLIIEELI